MKLKTKFQDEDFELGEVVDTQIKYAAIQRFKVEAKASSGGLHTFYYDSIKEFTDHWEDAPEEEKKVWFIDADGELDSCTQECEYDECGLNAGGMKSIGNYFETEEEAEKAVEKLKAWQRLKDKGFRFDGWDENHHNLGIIEFSFSNVEKTVYDFSDDLGLLFGGGK